MISVPNKFRGLSILFIMSVALCSQAVFANGPIGDHVNQLKANLADYQKEVVWLNTKVDAMVSLYAKDGGEDIKTTALMEYWEQVKFHAAIETSYVPVYASIWQGLYGVKQSIDKKKTLALVRQEQAKLEQVLWQALGAVKLASQYQDQGLLAKVNITDAQPTNSVEALNQVKMNLDRVLAKYAEQLLDEATNIVHDTYINVFEGVEGKLIAQDAKLVEVLEKDFNVTLPLALKKGASVDQVRGIVTDMQGKLDKAKTLLAQAEKSTRDVF